MLSRFFLPFFLVLLLLILGYFIYFFVKPPVSLERGEWITEDYYPRQSTTISRTESGLPVISATSMTDVAFAMGFVHARDQLWKLHHWRLASQNKISSFYGDDFQKADLLSAVITGNNLIYTYGEEQLNHIFSCDAVPEGEMTLFEAYASGINQLLRASERRHPAQFLLSGMIPEYWSGCDVYKVSRLQYWLLQTEWQIPLTNALMAADMPPGLLPYLFSSEQIQEMEAFAIDSNQVEAYLQLLEGDKQLRDLLAAPGQVRAVHHFIQPNLAAGISVMSGKSQPGFWSGVSIRGLSVDDTIAGFSIIGSPVLWAGNSGNTFWMPTFPTDANDHKLLIRRIDTRGAGRFTAAASLLSKDHLNRETSFLTKHTQTGFGLPWLSANGISSDTLQPVLVELDGFDDIITRIRPYLNIGELLNNPGSARQHSVPGPAFFHLHTDNPTADRQPPASSAVKTSLNIRENRLFPDEVHTDLIELSGKLAGIIQTFEDLDIIRSSFTYLSNWDGRFDRHSVAASLMELTLRNITINASRNYASAELFEMMQQTGYFDYRIGAQLINSHISPIRRSSIAQTASPVSDAFFGRRVQEATAFLIEAGGAESSGWRWGNLASTTFADHNLCANQRIDSPLTRRFCRQFSYESGYLVAGHPDFFNAANLTIRNNEPQLGSMATGFIMVQNTSNGIDRSLIQLPGFTSDKYSPFHNRVVNRIVQTETAPELFSPDVSVQNRNKLLFTRNR